MVKQDVRASLRTDNEEISDGSRKKYFILLPENRIKLLQSFWSSYPIFGVGLIIGSLGPILPNLGEHLGVHATDLGYLFSSRSVGYVIGSILAGRAFDRWKAHRLYSGASVIICLAYIFVPLCRYWWQLSLSFAAVGFGAGIADVGAHTMIVWIWGDRSGPFMQLISLCFGIGCLGIPIVIDALIALTGGIIWPLWIVGLLWPITCLSLFVRSPMSPGSAHGHSHHSVPTDDQTEGAQVQQDAPVEDKKRHLSIIWLISLFIAIYTGQELSYGGWLFTYATDRGLADTTGAAYMTSCYYIALTVARLVAVPISNYIRPLHLIAIDLAGSFLCCVILILVPSSVVMLWAISALLGIAMAATWGCAFALPPDLGIANVTGKDTAIMISGVALGEMVMPALVALLFQKFGTTSLQWSLAISLIAHAGVLGLLWRFASGPITSVLTVGRKGKGSHDIEAVVLRHTQGAGHAQGEELEKKILPNAPS